MGYEKWRGVLCKLCIDEPITSAVMVAGGWLGKLPVELLLLAGAR